MNPVQLVVRSCILLLTFVALAFTPADSALAQSHRPEVKIVAPLDGAVFAIPAEALIIAQAQDLDGYLTITHVEFFDNGVSLGIKTNLPTLDPIGPFKIQWRTEHVGPHVLTAQVWDQEGVVGNSEPVTVTVLPKLVPGVLKREVYLGIPGLLLSDLTNNVNFPEKPDVVGTVRSLETPSQYGENYGQRLTGYLRPAVTGEYRFFIASDDQGAFYLSTGMEPAAKRLLAWQNEWTMPRNWTTSGEGRVSGPVNLEAGKYYYLEALHKEGAGGDNFAVTWQKPGASVPEPGAGPIPGEFLAAVPLDNENEPPRVSIHSPTNGSVLELGNTVPVVIYAKDFESPLLQVNLLVDGLHVATAAQTDADSTQYVARWTPSSPGEHHLKAVATDPNGFSATSSIVAVTIKDQDVTDREFHIASVYSGDVNGQPSHNNEQGLAAVTVDRPGKRVTLFLSAYEPVLWQIEVTPGTVIEKVIVGGYYAQKVDGNLGGAQIIPLWCVGRPNEDCVYLPYSLESSRFYQEVPKLRTLTGLEISSFHGDYKAPFPTPILVNEVQDDIRLRSDYPQPVPPDQLPAHLSFALNFFTGSVPGNNGVVHSRNYTLAGPVEGDRLLPGIRVVGDGNGYYYAAGSHDVFRVNSRSGEVVSIAPGLDLPELGWPMGITYDPVGDRMLLVSLGGEGYLYGYDADDHTWSLVRSMDNYDVDCIVYYQPQNVIYALEIYRGDYARPRILKFSTSGAIVGDILLPVQPFDIGVSGYQSELVSAGDYLVLMLAPDQGSNQDGEERMYLIDPRSGESWLTYRRSGAENKLPTVAITTPSAGAIIASGKAVEVVASATDSDGQVRTVEFLLDGRSLGLGEPIAGTKSYKKSWTNPLPGPHELLARATDDDFGIGVSAPVTVTVSNTGTNTNDVPDLIFELTFFSSFEPGPGTLTSRRYSLHGPKFDGNLLPGVRLSPTGGQRYLYAAHPHHVLQVDTELRIAEEMEVVAPDLPEVSWPMSMAYDPVRSRALLVTLGGEGLLYSYNTTNAGWSVISSMNNVDLDSIVWHRADDSIYGLSAHLNANSVLYRFNASGEKTGELILPIIELPIGAFQYQSELVSVGAYIVLLIGPERRITTDPNLGESRMYVIDPNSGQTWLTYRKSESHYIPPTVGITSPTNGTVFRNPEIIPIAAKATDADGKIVSVEFLANGISLGFGDGADGTNFKFAWRTPRSGEHTLVAKATDNEGLTGTSPPIHIRIGPESLGFVTRSFDSNLVILTATPLSNVQVYAVEDRIPKDWLATNISNEGTFDLINQKVKFGPYFDNEPRHLTYTVIPPAGFTGTAEFYGVASADGVSSVVQGECCWTVPLLTHPADQSPTDFSISINEVAAYSAAWKTGGVWNPPPSPIDIDYVTRAASLWRGGESYSYNPAVPPPLCWQNFGPIPLPQEDRDQNSPVARRTPDAVVPGQLVQVQIDIPAGNAHAYAVQESIPSGYRAVTASHGGVIDPTRRVIRWGPFFDASQRTIAYELVSDANVPQSIIFSGLASFDGKATSITGTTLARSGSKVVLQQKDENAMVIRVEGMDSPECVIETSTDLNNWSPVGAITTLNGEIHISIPTDSEAGPRYYRAKQTQ